VILLTKASIISKYIFLLLQSSGVDMVQLYVWNTSGYFHYIFSWKWSFQAYCGSGMGIMWGNNSLRNNTSNCLFIWVIFWDWKITRGKRCTWEGWAEVYCPLHNASHHMTNKTTLNPKILLSWDVTLCLWINSSSHSEGSWCLQNTGNCTQGHSVTCQMISIFSNTVVKNSVYSQTIFIKAGWVIMCSFNFYLTSLHFHI
jgi:hypothetical protein